MRQRRIYLIVGYALLLLPTMLIEASQALKGGANSPLEWLPPSDSTRQTYDACVKTFGAGDICIVSWPGCSIHLRELDDVTQRLRHDAVFFHDEHWYFDNIVSGRDLVGALLRSGQPAAFAIPRLQNVFIGPDGETTCLAIGFTKDGVRQRASLVREIQSVIQEACGVSPDEQHMAGPIIDGLSVDEASNRTLQRLAPLSSLIVFITAVICLRSWRDAIIVFALSLYCQLATLALVSFCGDSMSALLVVLPPLIQVLALAGGIHLVNYFRDATHELEADPTRDPADAGRSTAVQQTWKSGWLPCVLSSGTTIVGMASLTVSHLEPIRDFGVYAACGVIITTLVVLSAVPVLLGKWSVAGARRPADHAAGWDALALTMQETHWFVVLVFALGIAVATQGLQKIQTSVRIETLFREDSRVLSDYRWLEQHVGPLVPVEVLVSFDSTDEEDTYNQLAWIRSLETHLASHAQVEGTISAATFLPSLPTAVRSPSALAVAAGARLLPSQLASEVAAHAQSSQLLAVAPNKSRTWRIRGFMSSADDLEYESLLDDIESQLRAKLSSPDGRPLTGVTLATTGTMPMVHRIQYQLLGDLRTSFLVALLIILVVMTILQGSLVAGTVAMIPNVFPTFAVFATLGWWEVPLDIGSVMTASVALGVAVDDTLHFLTAFQRASARGLSRREAVQVAYRRCGTAILQTSVICAAGMAMFSLGEFVPTARFAWMMVSLFGAALLGDLILLPCLLLGPLGRFFVE
ncbi:MAG: MMPL family transporter, partial [Planctomycetales bacterium]|nr:MMPL family transporter [Planctomycetales bacterium]